MKFARARKCGFVAAEAVVQKSGNASDSGNTDSGQVMNLPVRQILLQKFDDLPAIYERLELRRRTQIPEKNAALVDGAERNDCFEQFVLAALSLAVGILSVGLHDV